MPVLPTLDAEQAYAWYYLYYTGDFFEDGSGESEIFVTSDTSFGGFGDAGGLIFRSVGIPSGATISSCVLSYKITHLSGSYSSMPLRWAFQDIDSAVMPTDQSSAETDAGEITSAYHDQSLSGATTGWKTSPDLSNSLQEVIDRVGWATGQHIQLIAQPANYLYDASIGFNAIECASEDQPYLDIVYLNDSVEFQGEITINESVTAWATGKVKTNASLIKVIPLTLVSTSESNTVAWVDDFSVPITVNASGLNDPTREGTADLDDLVLTVDAIASADVDGTAALPIVIGFSGLAETHRYASAGIPITVTADSDAVVPHEASADIDLDPVSVLAVSKQAEGSSDLTIAIGLTANAGHKYQGSATNLEVLVSTDATGLHDIFGSLTVELDSVILLVTHSLPQTIEDPETPLLDSNCNFIVGEDQYGFATSRECP
jgi:hypothetical protein